MPTLPAPPDDPPEHTLACGCPSFAVYRRLIVIAVGLPLLEALLLSTVGASAAGALAPHSSALAPFGVFHDLRWLLVFHPSWLAFGLEMTALIVVRSAITALLVRASWPTTKRPPSPLSLAVCSAAFTIVSVIMLMPFAALLLGMAVVSLSWLFYVAVPAVLAVAALTHHGAVVPSWWRERPPARTMIWVLLSFLVLTLASACIVLAPAPLRPVAVAGTGLFNAWAWHSVVHVVCCRERSPRFLPVAPVGVAVLIGVIVLGVSAGYSLAARDRGPSRVATATQVAHADDDAFDDGRPVLVVSGFGSTLSGEDSRVGQSTSERRFSYAGLTATGRPQPYEAADTYQDLSISIAMMADQVATFHDDVERPITLIAESEGALIAKAYLMSHPDAPVGTLVLLSPLVEPGGAYYPPEGDDGWGAAAGWSLHWITDLTSSLSRLEVTSNDGLIRSLADNAPALRGMLACPIGGVDQLAVFPLADAVVGPRPHLDGVTRMVVPAFHGGLANNPDARRIIRAVLEDGVVPEGGWWQTTETVIRAGATAWRVPTLPISVNPAWDAAHEATDCAGIADLIEAWVR